MLSDLQTEASESRIANFADYAAADFEACLTEEEAERFGGEILSGQCPNFRMAVVILSKSKKELLAKIEGASEARVKEFAETFMTTLEVLQDTEKFIKALAENNEKAIMRLLCLLSSVIPEPPEKTLAA